MDTPKTSTGSLVIPATGPPEDLVRTLRSIPDRETGALPCPVVVPFPAGDLAIPGLVAGVVADATCIPVPGAVQWHRLVEAGTAAGTPGWVAVTVAGMVLPPGWHERLLDRMELDERPDLYLGGIALQGSLLEALRILPSDELASWPETSQAAATDPWQLVAELADMLQPAPAGDATATLDPARSDLDRLGVRLASVLGVRRDDADGIRRVEWEQVGVQRGLTSIVILTLNQLELTRSCIESIARCTPEPHELVIVDNGSTDGTLEYLDELEADGATVVRNRANHGFGGGCNQGLAVARGEYLLLLNNDTVVTDGWLGAMLDAYEADPRRGVIGPCSNHVSGPQQVAPVGYDTDSLDGLEEFARQRRETLRGSGRQVSRLIGFCMLMHRSVLERIGGFDLRFGTGNLEDDDICLRAGIAGHASWMCEDSFVHHVGGSTFAGEGIDYDRTLLANWMEFVRKWSFPEGSVDWKQRSYSAAALLGTRRFSLDEHWEGPWAVPQRDHQVGFVGRGMQVYVPHDWALPGEFEAALDEALRRWGPEDDVTVVVRCSDDEGYVLAMLEAAADRAGDDALPDVVVVPAGPEATDATLRSCSHLLAYGRARAALVQAALHRGVQAIDPASRQDPAADGEAPWRAA